MSAKTIRVFEHQSLYVGDPLTQAQFDALVRFADRADSRYFSIGHRRIRFSHYVGFVQVGSLGIEVLPKADRGSSDTAPWRAALLDMLRIAGGLKLHATSLAHLSTREASLLELYVAHFVALVAELQRQGLAKAYRRVQQNAPVVRGRILVTQQIRRNASSPHLCFTEHATYDRNSPLNRALCAALCAVRQLPVSAVLQADVQRTLHGFPDQVERHISLDALDRIRLNRNTERYAEALDLARLILHQLRPDLDAGQTNVLAILLDMNRLWERYVLALLQRSLVGSGLSVSGQASRRFWQPVAGSPRLVRPDIVLKRGDVAELVIDTKWKRPTNGRPSAGDLQQMFAYNELFGCGRSILLYPQAGDGVPTEGRFEGREHGCSTAFLSVVRRGQYRPDEAARELTELVGEAAVPPATLLT